MSNMISVAVIDEYPLYRTGIVLSLRTRKKFIVVGQGESNKDALDICSEKSPRILLLNKKRNIGIGPLKIITAIKNGNDKIKVIIISDIEEKPDDLVSLLDAGADGYLMKNVCMSGLVNAMYAVDNDETYVDPRLAARQLAKKGRLNGGEAHLISADLSPRENQVLEKVAEGLTNKEVARQLELSDKTIKHYLSNIMQKLHVRNRVEATIEARARFGMAK